MCITKFDLQEHTRFVVDVTKALQVLVVDVAWVADDVNDSGYRELHRYMADDTDQMLAALGCDLNDLDIPM